MSECIDTVVISGDNVYSIVMFGTLVSVLRGLSC